MKRNLESRVETVVPVEGPKLRKEIRFLLDAQLADPRNAWDMQPDGTYLQRVPEDPHGAKSSQQLLIERADERQRKAARLTKRSTKGVGRRN
jgi:polyphosphate kinase